MNDFTARQEQTDGTLLVTSGDGDRKLVFKQDLKVLFSNNTSQVTRITIMNERFEFLKCVVLYNGNFDGFPVS